MSLEKFVPDHERAANAFMSDVSSLLRRKFSDLNANVSNFTADLLKEADEAVKIAPDSIVLITASDALDRQSAIETEIQVIIEGKTMQRIKLATESIDEIASKFSGRTKVHAISPSNTKHVKDLPGAILIYIFH